MPTTRTYSPLPPMIPAGDIFWTNPCILREPNPCPHTSGVRVGMCAAVATKPCRPTACEHEHPRRALQSVTNVTIPNSSFLIPHCNYTFSAKERDPETGLSYFGSRYYSSDLSVWLSVDQMAAKYPSLSPYVYCANNPVKLVDPDGEAYIPIGDEDAKAAAVAQIQNKTNLNVYIDEDGFLRADGKAKTKIDKFLQSSCNDDKIQVELDCRNDNSFSWSDGSIRGTENGGGYDGNFYDGDCVVARQCICPTKLEEYDKSMGDKEAGLTMIHEMAEGYFGGKIAMRKKESSPMAGVTGSTYNRAHRMATRIAWGNRGGVYREDDIRYNSITNKIEKGPFKTLIGYERKP